MCTYAKVSQAKTERESRKKKASRFTCVLAHIGRKVRQRTAWRKEQQKSTETIRGGRRKRKEERWEVWRAKTKLCARVCVHNSAALSRMRSLSAMTVTPAS